MADKQQMKSRPKATSELQRFTLGFEYNKTLREIKRDVRHRTDRNN